MWGGWQGADMPHRDAHLAGHGSGSVLLGKGEISPERQPPSFPEPSGPESSRAPWEVGAGSYQPDKPRQEPVAPGPD